MDGVAVAPCKRVRFAMAAADLGKCRSKRERGKEGRRRRRRGKHHFWHSRHPRKEEEGEGGRPERERASRGGRIFVYLERRKERRGIRSGEGEGREGEGGRLPE